MRDGIKDDYGSSGELQRQERSFRGLQLDRFEHARRLELVEGGRVGECYSRAEENLAVVVPEVQRVGLMRGIDATRGTHRETHDFYGVIEQRLSRDRAESTMEVALPQALERGVGVGTPPQRDRMFQDISKRPSCTACSRVAITLSAGRPRSAAKLRAFTRASSSSRPSRTKASTSRAAWKSVVRRRFSKRASVSLHGSSIADPRRRAQITLAGRRANGRAPVNLPLCWRPGLLGFAELLHTGSWRNTRFPVGKGQTDDTLT